MLHLLLRTSPGAFAAGVRTLAADGLWTWEKAQPTGDPGTVRVELSVGDATMALPVAEVRSVVAALSGSTG
jgi:predicted small integral membrane protein